MKRISRKQIQQKIERVEGSQGVTLFFSFYFKGKKVNQLIIRPNLWHQHQLFLDDLVTGNRFSYSSDKLKMFLFALIFPPLMHIVNLAEFNIQTDLDCFTQELPILHPGTDFDCLFSTKEIFYHQKYKCAKRSTMNHTLTADNLTCSFNIDAAQQQVEDLFPNGALPANINARDISWSCRLAGSSQICNGISQCLTDECGCINSTSDVFYCADGSGCVTWDKLCDDTQDCKDGSDECSCANHLVFYSPVIEQWVCFSQEHYCKRSMADTIYLFNNTPEILKNINCDLEQDEVESRPNPIKSCFEEAIDLLMEPVENIVEFCRSNCSHIENFKDGWGKFCNHIVGGIDSYPFSFVCNVSADYNSGQNYPLENVCDGKTDCSNGADEFGCPLPDRFHCNSNVTAEWVHVNKTCDSVKDCSNGADECGTCQFEVLSSSESLIRSKIIVAVTSIMGILIVCLNIKEGYICWKSDCTSKTKSTDKIFLFQIFLYDGLMGVYLCSIVLAAMVLELKGNYCLLERDWRASLFCSVLGIMFSLSSHGSLIAIASVSITRFLKCHSFAADISMRKAVIGSIVGACLNIFHSLMPILPINVIQDTFRTGVFLENLNENPFFASNPIEMSRMTDIYNRMFQQEGNHDLHKMSKELSNITSNRNLFEFTEIGYYGNTGLCVHNIFKDYGNQLVYRVYKIIYCSVLVLLLSIVSIAYVMIVLKQRRSNKAVANSDATASNSSVLLTVKVALMIGSQLTSWIPFIITVLYFQYMTSEPATSMAFEVFSLVVIPINSFLNPIFYSELYKKLLQKITAEWNKIKNIIMSQFYPTRVEPADVAVELQLFNTGNIAKLPRDTGIRNEQA